MIHYAPWGSNGVRVSKRWRVVLLAARKAGVSFQVNSGHRTIRQQTALFHQNMRLTSSGWVPRPGHPLTAFPTPLAPHIRTGNPAHALDVDVAHGDGAQGLAHWLRQKGAHVSFPVPGEPWHLQIDAADLDALWRRFR